MGLVIDTVAYSALEKNNAQIAAAIRANPDIFIPTIVIGELLYGFRNGDRLKDNFDKLQTFLSNPRVKIVPIDQAVADHYSQIRLQQELIGKPVGVNDLWIAAVCRRLQTPLLTLDSDFNNIEGLTLVV